MTKTMRKFSYDGRKLEVRADQSASGFTWSVRVWEGDKKANGAFYSVEVDTLDDAQRSGIDLIADMAATAESDFITWSDRAKAGA